MARTRLSDLNDWKLEDRNQDVRGKPFVDASGTRLGILREVIADTENERVESIDLDHGQQYPVEALDLGEKEVVLRQRLPPGTLAVSSYRLTRWIRGDTSR